MVKNWSSDWKSSTKPEKQRKYRRNAPLHVKDRFVSVNLDPELREELGIRNITLNAGDRVEVMRGDFAGSSGIVSTVDRDEEKVYINGLEQEKNDGTKREVPLDPSNLQIQALNLEDPERIEDYDVEDASDIEVDQEEVEEVLEEDEESEMMQQMQGGEASEEESEEDEIEEELEDMEETEEEIEELEEEIEEEVEEIEEELDEESGESSDSPSSGQEEDEEEADEETDEEDEKEGGDA